MSRLIIKNLPKSITEEKLRTQFSQKGTITDIQLKYTKDGVFRQFAFIGYENEEQAAAAIKYFHNTCIQTNRIQIETCAALGGNEKPQSWSKHSKDSPAYRKAHGLDKIEQLKKETEWLELQKNKKTKLDEILGDHKSDPEFIEFMKAHDKNRNLWSNDGGIPEEDIVANEQQETENDELSSPRSVEEKEDEHENEKVIEKDAVKNISDLDYMKVLIKKSSSTKKPSKVDKESDSIDLFTIKIHDVPYTTKRQDILKFFKPLKPYSVRLPVKVRGFCYVGFKLENDFKKAMIKDKSFIKGKQVFFSDFTEKNKITKNNQQIIENDNKNEKSSKWSKQEECLKNEENVSESGKIFFRNLAYTTTEEDLRKLFQMYGEIADINLPIDTITRKIKGFGTVTFVMPEHAVQAFDTLDGSTFHGRTLHLIPAKGKVQEEINENDDTLSFKAKRQLKLKKSATQSHNWNTLFMGANAVADILAKKFNTKKDDILDTNAGGSSAAVRLALGETQIVMEMKKFLEDNDVELSAFESAATKRSNTIILAKNLAAETTVAELKPVFSEFGLIGRIVLPPSGVTGLIEFLDSFEAKKAFRKLAYSKFKNLPLYLEWAPENTFSKNVDGENIRNAAKDANTENVNEMAVESTDQQIPDEIIGDGDDDDDDDDEEPEPNTTLFLRNLNFKTRENIVQNHFKHLGPIHIAQVAMRKDPENPRNKMSLGYGFIQFKKSATLEKALKLMQFTQIDGNQIELKRSDRTLKLDEKSIKKQAQDKKQTGTKILVRNIPFQAKTKEIYEIFKAFGELRSVRLPKKMAEEGHRGFGFVDYFTKNDAKKAFQALRSSTHLYGRHLVLEWASTNEDDVEVLRKRTAASYRDSDSNAKHFRKANFDENHVTALQEDDADDNE